VLIGPLITPAALRVSMISSGALRGPVADDLVQLVLVAAARDVVDEPVVGGELGLPIAAHNRRKTVSWLAAITTQLPSALR
jgi:hypothetical protein